MLDIRGLWRAMPLSVLLFAPMFIWQETNTSELSSDHDLLVYSIYDYDQGTRLFLYDPATGEHKVILELVFRHFRRKTANV